LCELCLDRLNTIIAKDVETKNNVRIVNIQGNSGTVGDVEEAVAVGVRAGVGVGVGLEVGAPVLITETVLLIRFVT
jgi:hypothetical protein